MGRKGGLQCLGEDQEGGRWVQGERVVIRPVDPVTIPDGATVFFHLVAGTPLLSVRTSWRIRNWLPIAARTRNRLKISCWPSGSFA